MESLTKEIGERIRGYRNKKGWSQSELAERAGCHFTFIGSVERGEKVPTIDTVFKICKALELPMDVLFENIVVGDDYSEIPKKFYNLISTLPEKEQSDLYKLLIDIIEFHNNNK